MDKNNVVLDFDGVIHSYKSGWKGEDNIPDEPVPGIKEAIEELRKNYRVVIVSTRCKTSSGILAIWSWLKKHNITVDDVQKDKPPAVVYIDDRAICFDGDTKALVKKVNSFKSWID